MIKDEIESSFDIRSRAGGRILCPSCSSAMAYDAAVGSMRCRSCSSLATGDASTSIPSHSLFASPFYSPAATFLMEQASEDAHPTKKVLCGGCGCKLSYLPSHTVSACPFCGSHDLSRSRDLQAELIPDAVLPWSISEARAQLLLKEWLLSHSDIARELKRWDGEVALQQIYLPYWLFDGVAKIQYEGSYWKRNHGSEDEDAGQPEGSRLSWAVAVSGETELPFQRALIPASMSIERGRLNALGPWDMDALLPFGWGLLDDVTAQTYQVELAEGFQEAKESLRGVIEDAALRDMGHAERKIKSLAATFPEASFRYVLLPVWLGTVVFKEKRYTVLVNATSGAVQGDYPREKARMVWNLFLLSLLVELLLVGLFFLVGHFSPSGGYSKDLDPPAVQKSIPPHK